MQNSSSAEETNQKRNSLIADLNRKQQFILSGISESDQDKIAAISSNEFDVLICGGGPAGLFTAIELTKLQIHCCLFERSLLLESDKTWALPDTIVEQYSLHEAVEQKHDNTMIRDYFGLNYPSQIDYCIMNQTKLLYLLAKQIDAKYCTIIDNCELTAYSRSKDRQRITAKTEFNCNVLMNYCDAEEKYPRAISLLNLNPFFYRKYNPEIVLNCSDELDYEGKLSENIQFTGKILVDAGGYNSNLNMSLHRQKQCSVWKCLVYEFEDLAHEPQEIIWDLAIPTRQSANFWVDVSSPTRAGVGVMVLTTADETNPEGTPSKHDIEVLMSKWLNIKKISGRFVRERYGLIPMTDFKEPAAYDNILFIGASATRQIPNTGFGFFSAAEEAALAAPVIKEALEKRAFTQNDLRSYDLQWLYYKEIRMVMDIILQDFHYAYKTDEYFHEYTECCVDIPPFQVKRQILGSPDFSDLKFLWELFMRAPHLLDKHRLDKSYHQKFIKNFGLFWYILLSQKLKFYTAEGSEMFRHEPPKLPVLPAVTREIHLWICRKLPLKIFTLLSQLIFTRPVQLLLISLKRRNR